MSIFTEFIIFSENYEMKKISETKPMSERDFPRLNNTNRDFSRLPNALPMTIYDALKIQPDLTSDKVFYKIPISTTIYDSDKNVIREDNPKYDLDLLTGLKCYTCIARHQSNHSFNATLMINERLKKYIYYSYGIYNPIFHYGDFSDTLILPGYQKISVDCIESPSTLQVIDNSVKFSFDEFIPTSPYPREYGKKHQVVCKIPLEPCQVVRIKDCALSCESYGYRGKSYEFIMNRYGDGIVFYETFALYKWDYYFMTLDYPDYVRKEYHYIPKFQSSTNSFLVYEGNSGVIEIYSSYLLVQTKAIYYSDIQFITVMDNAESSLVIIKENFKDIFFSCKFKMAKEIESLLLRLRDKFRSAPVLKML